VKEDSKWIWQCREYPHFVYDSKKIELLIESISRKQGELKTLSRVINSKSLLQTQLNALESEIISSSAIEGEILDRDSLKSSIKEKLAIELPHSYLKETKESSFVEILLDAHSNYADGLSLQKLYSWHYKLFENYHNRLWKIEVGSLRDSGTMQIVSGVVGKQRVFYEAPPPSRLKEEMQEYIEWFNTTPASLMKATIAHLWFVIIHPFDDGNGRLTRVITDMVLSEIEESTTTRLYSISKSINSSKKGYYRALEHTTGYIPKDTPMDITYWCEWFLQTLYNSITEAIEAIEYVVQKARFWDTHRDSSFNERQTRVLNALLDKDIESLSTKRYTKIAQISSATASRDIKELVSLGCIKQVEGSAGRSVRYEVVLLDMIGN